MSAKISDAAFADEILVEESQEIQKRRSRIQQDPAAGQWPLADKDRLGLALSGGGIRSATFCLGAIQALAAHSKWKLVDYLSTVSGGGYIGSCLSSVLNVPSDRSGDRFPFAQVPGEQESGAIGHLRNGSNYLAPGGLWDKLKIPAIVLRGIITNLLAFLPW